MSLVEQRLVEDAKEVAFDLRSKAPELADLIQRLRDRIVALEENQIEVLHAMDDAEDAAAAILDRADLDAEGIREQVELVIQAAIDELEELKAVTA